MAAPHRPVVVAFLLMLASGSIWVSAQGDPAIHAKRVAQAQALIAEKGPEYYLDTRTRAEADTPHNLADGVAKLEGRQLLLGPLFAGVVPDKYRLEFKPAASTDPTSSDIRAVYFEWEKVRLSAESPPLLVPGLYRVNLYFSTTTIGQPVGERAWVLVTDPTRYESARVAFEQARATVRSWGPQVPRVNAHTFLHAFLDVIK